MHKSVFFMWQQALGHALCSACWDRIQPSAVSVFLGFFKNGLAAVLLL